IPEHTDSFALKDTTNGEPYRLYNLDVFEYELNSRMAIYGSIPYIIAHGLNRTMGMFWSNAAETWVNIKLPSEETTTAPTTHWVSESGHFDMFVFIGPTLYDVSRQYTTIVGKMTLPPLYALGYHQCRWNYNDESDVLAVQENFDKANIPLDVIWLDIEHTDGKRYFTWDTSKFPHPEKLVKKLSDRERSLVTISDPHIKLDANFIIYSDMSDLGYFVKDSSNKDFEGWCWPGSSMWPDFFNPEVRAYWSECFSSDRYSGSNSYLMSWLDMNEPSVFNGPEITLPKSIVHFNKLEHRQLHNAYAYFSQKSSYEALLNRSINEKSNKVERPFLLSRGIFAGSQKFSAVWTGDNLAAFSHLEVSVKMLLSLNIAGYSFSGADVGGFFKDASIDLLKKWYLAGALQPFFRAHAHIETKRREPYLFPDVSLVAQKAINVRYQLMPYIYTAFFESREFSIPVMLPLWAEFRDENLFDIDDTYLLGRRLLCSPVLDESLDHIVELPKNETWFDYFTNEIFFNRVDIVVEEFTMPIFVRSGSIIPVRERKRRSLRSTIYDPITLKIYLSENQHAQGNLYIDDYISLNYLDGSYIYQTIFFCGNTIYNKNSISNKFKSDVWLERIIIYNINTIPTNIKVLYFNSEKNLNFTHEKIFNFNVLTIRKPSFKIHEEWKLLLK
ncbi:hypothetical protein A3Q56_06918, partial [Intoshia linei]